MWGAPMDVVAGLLGGSSRSVAQVVDRWRRQGWVLLTSLDGDSRWVVPTTATANRWLGWEMKGSQWLPTVYRAEHTAAVARLRLRWVGPGVPVPPVWVSERRLRHEVGFRSGRGVFLSSHVPDALWGEPGVNRVLVEVELSAKSPESMREALVSMPDACRAYRAVRVQYFAKSEAVKRNIAAALADLAGADEAKKSSPTYQPLARWFAPVLTL